MNTVGKKNTILIISMLLSAACYFALAYYTKREQSTLLFVFIGLAFIPYFYLIAFPSISNHHFKPLLFFAILFRVLFIVAIPQLSDDYSRFIWDGRLIDAGINPFVYLPEQIQEQQLLTGTANSELFTNMNSPHYYSVYPPILQAIFYISAKCSFNHNLVAIIIMRLFILLAEFGTYRYLLKLLDYLKLPKGNVFIYLLNPLVIIELSGNLHFEGVMLFFTIASLYYLLTYNLIYSSILFAFAFCTKMVPLVLLPLIIKKIGLKNGMIYSVVVGVVSTLLFLPFINQQLITNIGSSVGLYFQKFEFNASIYYLARWVGFYITGYNEIGIIGKLLPICSLLFILLITLKHKPQNTDRLFFESTLMILFIYYLCALIVHPWYVSFLVLMSVFSNFRFALVWSALILGSYLTYINFPYKENLWWVGIEYTIVLIWFVVEQRRLRT